jgi:lipoprotein-anchoring transpeptidase ErfK/SrfK
MKRFSLIVLLALTAAILLAQQPSTRDAQSPALPSAGKSSPLDAAAQKTTTSSTTATPPDDGLENVPDQNIDPTATAPPPPTDVNQQRAAVASVQKAIPAGALSLAASIGKNILVVRVDGRDVKTFPVSVGVKGHQTPQGHFGIRHIVWNPSWHPPNAAWAKNKKVTGPGSAENPMKVVKIFFQEPDYYIHGTDHEDKLGAAASHGCVRMSQANVYELGRLLQERAGAPRQPQWYAEVINGGQTASVMLPKAVPIVIGW